MKAVSVAAAAVVAMIAVGAASAAHADDCVSAPGRAEGVKLTVHVGDLRPNGEVAITVYPDDPRRFLAPRGKLMRIRTPTHAPVTSACFWLPKAGVYAVAVYHDANRNRDFDRNAVGLPTEGFGFSNDAPTKVGLPSFDSVRFRVPPGGHTLRIKARYIR